MPSLTDFGNTVSDNGIHVIRNVNHKPKYCQHQVYVNSDASGDAGRNYLYTEGYEYHSSTHDKRQPMCLYVKRLPLTAAVDLEEFEAA